MIGSKKIIIGDDLGSERYLSLLGKLEFLNIPFLRNYGIKPFIFGEIIYYPSFKNKYICMKDEILKNTRGGMGFGIAFPLPINDMLTLHLYHNTVLFNVI